MHTTVMLIAAYALAWAFAFGYMMSLAKRQAQLQREVDALRSSFEGYKQPSQAQSPSCCPGRR